MAIAWYYWVFGLFLGILWANAFEYVYHRWLLHLPRGRFARSPMMHHTTVGTPQEPEHATFGESPLYVFALFAVNSVPLIISQCGISSR